jgi:hypothetical protein
VRSGDEERFAGVIYATAGGLDALKARIQRMGIGAFRKLDRERLRALAYEITSGHSLTHAEAQALNEYYLTGRPQAEATGVISRLKAVADASVRKSSPVEPKLENAGGLSERTLLDQLRRRAGQLGDPDLLPNQLRARQEMTDCLREELIRERRGEASTEARLKLLLYSDPRLASGR